MAAKKNEPMNARSAAKAQAQAQVRAQERRTTVIIVAASVVGLALFGALIFFIINQGKVPELGTDGAVAPASADATGGVSVGTGGVAGVDVPTDAPRVDIYLDFMCPICNTFEQINAADLDTLRESGAIQLYYHPISILDRYSQGTEFSTRAAGAAGVVADKAPEAFHDFVNAMFANQPAENTSGLSDADISQIAVTAGVPEDVAGSLDSADMRKWATAATDRASQDGMQGTPTVRVSASGVFDEGEVLDPNTVPYFEAGGLKAYLESLG
ncbi:thioredoxin domain-containing protein [Demequina sp.]|uniref:DsbA family protein n=1 Tax=Demequina sp. TaxID=2050685 RepID=UPI0025F361D0|nr:thioredoxin domain-containing protein [Demequina sp.]